MEFAIVYTTYLLFLVILTLYFSSKTLKRKDLTSKLIFGATVLTAISTISYIVSYLTKSYLIVDIFSNIYFGTISLILPIFLIVTNIFTKIQNKYYRYITAIAFSLYGFSEFLMFMINIPTNFIIDFVMNPPLSNGEYIAPFFSYSMKPMYIVHLIYSYITIALVFIELAIILRKTPYGYKKQYFVVIFTLILVIASNAIFLFIPSKKLIARFDISLPGYYFIILMIYYSIYYYPEKGMINKFNKFILDNVKEGFVLFDYTNKMSFMNDNAKKYLMIDSDEKFELYDFITRFGITLPDIRDGSKPTTAQIQVKKGEEVHSLITTSRIIFNSQNQLIGYLFYFTNTDLENDPLTGFQTYNEFIKLAERHKNIFSHNVVLTILDIDGLSSINIEKGHLVGDEYIKELSKLMRQEFPSSSYFVRGPEADLWAFSYDNDEKKYEVISKSIQDKFSLSIQYAISSINENDNLLKWCQKVNKTLNIRKVLDHKSSRSNSLNSLIKALQEVDKDTLDHVNRTKILAENFADKLNLGFVEKNNLSLLSVLHDIGKIAVPLEILNKPTSLTNDEWRVMKSHVTKGYNIAQSSPVLRDIADEILHHHEKWDGTGYPDGLKGDDIPLNSRIVSIVDSFDAMISSRPYRENKSIKEAKDELVRCAGTQFDPSLVEVFLEVLKEADIKDNINEITTRKVEEKDTQLLDKFSVNNIKYTSYIIEGRTTIASIDKNFTLLTGYTSEDVKKGLLQIELIPEEEREVYMQVVAEQMTKYQQVFLEHRIVRKDGSIITVFCYGISYYDSAIGDYRDRILAFNVDESNLVKNK